MIFQRYKAKYYYTSFIIYSIILILDLHYQFIVNKTKDYQWFVQILNNYIKKKVNWCCSRKLKNKNQLCTKYQLLFSLKHNLCQKNKFSHNLNHQ